MAHCLTLEELAEGVEDADTLKRLIDYRCEFGHGYHGSPALPANEFDDFVRQAHLTWRPEVVES